MRTKAEILDNYDDFKKQGRNSTELRTFTELARLEVFIDIRDMLRKDIAQIIEELNFIANKD